MHCTTCKSTSGHLTIRQLAPHGTPCQQDEPIEPQELVEPQQEESTEPQEEELAKPQSEEDSIHI
jgi:hypothetical protein